MSRIVVHDQRNIYIWLKTPDKYLQLDYTPDLFSLMVNPSYVSYRFNGSYAQLEFMEHTRNGVHCEPFVHKFAYNYYHSNTDAVMLMYQFPEIERKGRRITATLNAAARPTIDHFNDDTGNNCKYNLSVMTQSENSQKHSYAGAFTPPYELWHTITDDGKYLIEVKLPDLRSGDMKKHYYRCDTARDVVSLLGTLYSKRGGVTAKTKVFLTQGDTTFRVATPQMLNTAAAVYDRERAVDDRHADILEVMYKVNPDLFYIWDAKTVWDLGNYIPMLLEGFGVDRMYFTIEQVGKR